MTDAIGVALLLLLALAAAIAAGTVAARVFIRAAAGPHGPRQSAPHARGRDPR